RSQSALDTITIKTTSDLGEYTPYFMNINHLRVFVADSTQAENKRKQDIELTFENFDNFTKWKEFVTKVTTLYGQDNTTDKAKLDAFSNALSETIISQVTSRNSSVTAETMIFYVLPFKTTEITYTNDTGGTDMARHGQSGVHGIGANQNTFLFSGYQNYEWKNENNKWTPVSTGKPWNKDRKTLEGNNSSQDSNVKGNGVLESFFEIDNVKWHFNGYYSGAELKLFGTPEPQTTNDTPTSDRYQTGLAVAIRFLLEAIITKDTMSRTTVETTGNTEATPSVPAEVNNGESEN
ncbi:hypothetical protein CJJ23_04855, partial [Mycoplasmopsis agassizii]